MIVHLRYDRTADDLRRCSEQSEEKGMIMTRHPVRSVIETLLRILIGDNSNSDHTTLTNAHSFVKLESPQFY